MRPRNLVLITGLAVTTLSLPAKAQSFHQTDWHAQNALVEQTYRALKAGKLSIAIDKGHALFQKRNFYRDRGGNRELRYHGATSLCIAYRLANQLEPAERFCHNAIDLRPTDWRGYINRAALYIVKGNYDRAEGDLSRARKYGAPKDLIRENTQIAQQAKRAAFAFANEQSTHRPLGTKKED